jgi:hypothetical protein
MSDRSLYTTHILRKLDALTHMSLDGMLYISAGIKGKRRQQQHGGADSEQNAGEVDEKHL